MGSGSVGIAAARLGRRFAGNDLNPEAVRITAHRLREFGGVDAPPEALSAPSSEQPGLLDALAPPSASPRT